jgi:hypothetical protein
MVDAISRGVPNHRFSLHLQPHQHPAQFCDWASVYHRAISQRILNAFKAFSSIYRHCRWSGAVLSSAIALYVVNFLAAPAQAQFLNQTQSWMTSVFPQADGFAPIIFNAIRLLLVLFIIFKAFQAVQAARNDEEWQSLVKIPLMIIVLVAVTDLTVGLITGGGSAGGGGGA